MEQQEAQTQVNPLDAVRERVRRREQRLADLRAAAQRAEEVEQAHAPENQSPSFWKEAGKAVWGAPVDMTYNGLATLMDATFSVVPVDWLYYIPRAKLQGRTVREGIDDAYRAREGAKDLLRNANDTIAPENETMVGGAARGIMTFLAPYAAWSKVGGTANGFREATARGAVIDFSLFDPEDGNLSELIQELDPDLQGTVLDFIATDPDDSDAENRLKMALEGAAFGTILEAIFKTARWVRGRKQIDEVHAQADTQRTSIEDLRGQAEEPEVRVDEPEVEPEVQAPREEPEAEAPAAQVEAEPVSFAQNLRDTFTLSAEQRAAFNQALVEGNEEAAQQALRQDFNLDTFNWDSVENPDQIRDIINVTSELVADHIDDVKGGIQSHEQTRRLGNLVGLSGEEVHNLYRDIRGDRGIAARFHAAQRTLLASAKEVFKRAEAAKARPNDAVTRNALMRQVQLHSALQAEVKGAQTEIARALNAMSILKNDAEAGFTEFDNVMRMFNQNGSKDVDRFIDDLLESRDLETLNAKVRDASRFQRVTDMFVEYTINSMLSSVKTHVINVTSNAGNALLYSFDRTLGGVSRRILYGDRAALREARIDLTRKVGSLGQALSLARQAWREGRPITDKRQRIEFETRKAWSVDGSRAELRAGDENLIENGTSFFTRAREVVRDVDGNAIGAVDYNWWQRAVNTLGNTIRIPARALITADEFFKTISRNAEIGVLAFRNADREATQKGLKYGSKKYEQYINKRMQELSDPKNYSPAAVNLRVEAIEKARKATFQESPMTEAGATMERLINMNPYVKLLIAPFFRTPMNILRQGLLDRSPLGFLVKAQRVAYANADPREKAEILARMSTGVAAIITFNQFTGAGAEDAPFQVVGKLPYDSSEKATGVLDYSIRVGDQWYQFNRLDPFGMWLGMVADAKTHLENNDDEEEGFAGIQASVAAFMNNIVNKTWARSMADLLELAEAAGSGGNRAATVERAWANFVSNQAGKLIPQFVKSTGYVLLEEDERTAREAWTFFDGLNKQLPVLNQDLPPRHDALGRPITWNNSAASLVNPFAASDGATNPIEEEMARLDFTIRPMPKSFRGGAVELDAAMYSRLTGLVGELKISRDGTLEETLNALVTSDDYQEWSDTRRVFEIKQRISIARRAASLTFLTDPAISAEFKETLMQEMQALTVTE